MLFSTYNYFSNILFRYLLIHYHNMKNTETEVETEIETETNRFMVFLHANVLLAMNWIETKPFPPLLPPGAPPTPTPVWYPL